MLRKDVVADQDADVIRLLQEKGAIIIGLTNVSELCMWWESHNHIHGRSNNPYNTTRIVGGSSGGEGAVQAAAGSIFGVGSDMGGSIRIPAFFNGIFGHKPSKFMISNEGQYPMEDSDLLNSFLGTGPMTRHAVDLKPLLSIMAGENSPKLKLDQPVDITKLKIYYQLSNDAPLTDPVDPDIKMVMRRVVEYLKLQYSIKTEVIKIQLLKKSMPIWMATMKEETRFQSLIMKKTGVGAVLTELVKNAIGCSDNTLIGLLTAISDRTKAQFGSEKYKYYLKVRDHLEKIFTDMLGENGVFLYPTHPTPAPYHNEPLLKAFNFSYTAIINCLGLPITTVP
ncbi:unnamed protein product [Diatraea saccharalis]|uniref:Amidase domain-containing protein n=1 Tax=Diatraea saccharalis TaxID=40085 RepID=A0A9N9R388_9NEOP|nr:unnamed protein product [Diatraea saccharalis]